MTVHQTSHGSENQEIKGSDNLHITLKVTSVYSATPSESNFETGKCNSWDWIEQENVNIIKDLGWVLSDSLSLSRNEDTERKWRREWKMKGEAKKSSLWNQAVEKKKSAKTEGNEKLPERKRSFLQDLVQ